MDVLTDQLTDEQRLVADAPADARLLVVAGPGTGKTHTLVRRAAALGTADDMGRTVLALSFTRAVVEEVRERARETGDQRVRAMTLDSFAARCVLDRGETLEGGFDATVRRATELIESGAVPLDLEHVLVDEIQDLVGPRGPFVLALLTQARCGFTLFGDPAQAIFDHESTEAERPFLERLTELEPLDRLELTADHRRAGSDGVTPRPDVPGAIAEHLRDLPRVSSTQQLATMARLAPGTFAVLTRTNGEALDLAAQLVDLGVPDVHVRQPADAVATPAWIARLVNGDPRREWSRRTIEPALEMLAGAPDPAPAWRMLRHISGEPADRVTLAALRNGIANGRLPFERKAPGGVTVSTIHRAKGLEWDHVAILAPRVLDLDQPEERVYYVACTRSRADTRRLERPKLDGVLRQTGDGRWTLRGWRGGLRRIECRFGDVDQSPAAPEPTLATDAQERLARRVAPGDLVEIVHVAGRLELHHSGVPIATMSSEFAEVLARLTDLDRVDRLTGPRILTIRAVAGSADAGEQVGLPATGIWLCPEISGFADIERGGQE